ncbi:MAG: hypothetical protein JXQ65_11355 [Candidatus Marinimicrobia bacterium]|nr:hypothetical protein [Candidatus Neomarinimicrobiota bacterium]
MNIFLTITLVITLISLCFDREKTQNALRRAIKQMVQIMPAFLWMLIFMSLVLTVFSEEQIQKALVRDNIYLSLALAVSCGSLAIIPGFIAFPLCGILLEKGVAYMVISGFTTTLMMVGIVTFPVEKEYLGVRLGIVRNLISLLIAMITALATGFFFGELF